MPCDYKRYPSDWCQIAARIREREGNCCKWCGAPNGATITRAKGGFWSEEPAWNEEDLVWHEQGGRECSVEYVAFVNECGIEHAPEGHVLPTCKIWNVKVVLTVAHLGTVHDDGTPGDKHDKHDVREENLAALCQSCHLAFDHADHIRHAAETRRRKRAMVQPALSLEFAP